MWGLRAGKVKASITIATGLHLFSIDRRIAAVWLPVVGSGLRYLFRLRWGRYD